MVNTRKIDPWSSQLTIDDYGAKVAEFGMTPFNNRSNDALYSRIPDPHYTMRRGIMFAHRDFDQIVDCIQKGKPYVMMTGLMPSGRMHLGHRLIVEQMKWYQDHGAELVVAISDIEAWVTRGITPAKAREVAINEYILNYLASGLKDNGKFSVYSQFARPELLGLATVFSQTATLGEMDGFYGFVSVREETNPKDWRAALTPVFSRRGAPAQGSEKYEEYMDQKRKDFKAAVKSVTDWSIPAGKPFFPFIQAADILHPQLSSYGGPKPVVVPVGIDQDPHMRLTRDIASRLRAYSIVPTEQHGKVAIHLSDAGRLNDLEKVLIEFGIEKRTISSEGERIDNIIKMPSEASALIVNSAGSSEIEPIMEYLSGAGFKDALVTNNRIGIYVRQGSDAAQLINLAADMLKQIGYKHLQILPEGGKIYINDLKEIDITEIDRKLADVEIRLEKPFFYKPAITYNKLAKGLKGGKMSSSIEGSAIFLTDSPEITAKTIKSATTAGRETVSLQRELGGEPDKCPIYELQMLVHPDDSFVADTYVKCSSGERLCGECKAMTSDFMTEWQRDFNEKRRKIVETGRLEEFVSKQHMIKKGDPLFF